MDQQSSLRPRAHSRAFSSKSDKSSGSKVKEHLTDNPADKQRRDSLWKGIGSKANPNAAITEQQPGDLAVLEKPTLDSLRNVQHKDTEGNAITEPDLSNPTRPRWERPLDTIRSFEKAIDGGYKRRSMSRSESYDAREQFNSNNRRSSYYGNGFDNATPSPSRGSQYNGGYYGGSRRTDGYFDDGTSPMAPPTRNRFSQRMNHGPSYSRSASRSNSAFGMNHQPVYNDPYDASAANGNNSDSTGPWANSTDPSSENSSIDKAQAAAKPAHVSHHMDNYGYDAYNNGAPIMEEYASDSDGAYGSSVPRTLRNGNRQNGQSAAPAAPAVRGPIKLGGPGGEPTILASQGGSLPSAARVAPAKEEKKKGFFKKRFSKA